MSETINGSIDKTGGTISSDAGSTTGNETLEVLLHYFSLSA
jgi:uncharacterized protein YjbJ (UPF0337 family)